MTSVVVRSARAGEERALARLMIASRNAARRGVYDAGYLERLSVQEADHRELSTSHGPSWVWVAERHGKLLGFARIEPWREGDTVSIAIAFLSHLYVHPQHFREGLGSGLIDEASKALLGLGFRTLRAWVVVDADDAVRFYTATGWDRLGKEQHLLLGSSSRDCALRTAARRGTTRDRRGKLQPVSASDLSPELRRDLLRYLGATSKEHARLIGRLVERNAGMADVRMDLEADYDLRTRLEIELLPAGRPAVMDVEDEVGRDPHEIHHASGS